MCNFFMIPWLSPFSRDTITFYCSERLTDRLSALFTDCRRQNKSSCLTKSHWILILVITETSLTVLLTFVFLSLSQQNKEPFPWQSVRLPVTGTKNRLLGRVPYSDGQHLISSGLRFTPFFFVVFSFISFTEI